MALLSLGTLANGFDVIVTGDEVLYGKPAPDIFLLAAQRLQISPQYCLVLEDSEVGVQAAHAAEMTAIMIPDLKQPAAQLTRLCSSLHEVKELLMSL